MKEKKYLALTCDVDDYNQAIMLATSGKVNFGRIDPG
jgi:hypothetical protein